MSLTAPSFGWSLFSWTGSPFGRAEAPETPIRLLPGAVKEAFACLAEDAQTRERLDRVAKLIDGFETPFGMELLATVHWAATHDGIDPSDGDQVAAAVCRWSERKAEQMKPELIHAARQRLEDEGWLKLRL